MTVKEPPKKRPNCPHCRIPTIHHCAQTQRCDWWRCAKCQSYGQSHRWYDNLNNMQVDVKP